METPSRPQKPNLDLKKIRTQMLAPDSKSEQHWTSDTGAGHFPEHSTGIHEVLRESLNRLPLSQALGTTPLITLPVSPFPRLET